MVRSYTIHMWTSFHLSAHNARCLCICDARDSILLVKSMQRGEKNKPMENHVEKFPFLIQRRSESVTLKYFLHGCFRFSPNSREPEFMVLNRRHCVWAQIKKPNHPPIASHTRSTRRNNLTNRKQKTKKKKLWKIWKLKLDFVLLAITHTHTPFIHPYTQTVIERFNANGTHSTVVYFGFSSFVGNLTLSVFDPFHLVIRHSQCQFHLEGNAIDFVCVGGFFFILFSFNSVHSTG